MENLKFSKRFRSAIEHFRKSWTTKVEEHKNFIYGGLGFAIILLFGLVIYLLRGMVQFI